MQRYEFAISLTNPLTHSTAAARFWVAPKPSAASAYRDVQFDPTSIVGGHACCPPIREQPLARLAGLSKVDLSIQVYQLQINEIMRML